ncbi:hypothetical protein [Paraliomyxa miuraensis]|uniref:hypothetical protein n=1 Tax=Paraliomyxa miuraensis TaxID=376150 RepID=UPI0022516EC4|nr:hypothetical protein [Paraliomyxa miuraensis]MCX4244436.1 hypothetical protein [Paraliomyxa miuraensis]
MGTSEDDDGRARIDREAILARRRRFVAATLTGLTTSTLATACPCLKVAPSDAPAGPDAAGEAAEPEDAARQDDGDPAEEANPYDGGDATPEGAAEPDQDDAPEGDRASADGRT